MFRSAAQSALRTSSRTFRLSIPQAPRRFASTSAANKPRSWKSSALRWGLAGAAVYYYNTSPVFADQCAQTHIAPPHDPEPVHTLESLAARKRAERTATTHPADASVAPATTTTGPLGLGGVIPGSPEGLEEEADQQGAFNPETGEINWDCPCLGGMAHGPCGEEFKAAFSCFVYSTDDPKGMDCIDKFRGMQDCFRKYPDIYGAELEDDEEEPPAEGASAQEGASQPAVEATEGILTESPALAKTEEADSTQEKVSDLKPAQGIRPDPSKVERSNAATKQVKIEHEPLPEADEAVSKRWHNTTDAAVPTQ